MKSKNPCIQCDLLPADKNNPVCKKCKKRVDYVQSLGAMTHSLPDRHTGMAAAQPPDAPAKVPAAVKTMHQAELFVQDYCQQKNLDIEILRNGRKTRRWANIRHDLAIKLRRGYDLTQAQIGELINLNYSTVAYIFRKTDIDFKDAYQPDLDIRPDKSIELDKPAEPIEPDESNSCLELDFDDYPDLYTGLQTMAADECRNLDQQIYYLIKREIKRRDTGPGGYY